MALPVIPDNTMLQMVVRGTDWIANDMENVLFGLYLVGGTPTVGGLTIGQMAQNFLTAWSGLMTPHMSAGSSIDQCTVRTFDAIVPIPPNRFLIQSSESWTIQDKTQGTVAGDPYPGIAAFTIEKRTFASGRGRQGSIRLWGIPEDDASGDLLEDVPFTAFQAALDAHGPDFLVGAVGKTDAIILKVMNGKLANVNPGHPPVFYTTDVEQFVLRRGIGSQITRKPGRRRRKLP
jgi:hypothetical protein